MNTRLLATRPYSSKQIADSIAGDPEAINVAIGEPDFPPSQRILNTITALMSEQDGAATLPHYHYAPARGIPALRSAIAERYERLYGVQIDSETQVLITHGGTEAIWLTIFSLTNPGDEVIIPDPCYALYEPITSSLGRNPVRVSTSPEAGFMLQIGDLMQHVTDRTRLLIINSPENPTGVVYSREQLQAITALAHERNIYVMHDEVYDRFVYGHTHTPALVFDPNLRQTIMINSLSKQLGITGWRLGWLIASPEIVAQATKAHTFVNLATSTLSQQAVAGLLNDPAIEVEMLERAAAIQARGHRLYEGLRTLGGFTFPAGPPMGGFYLFTCISDLYQAIDPQADPDILPCDAVAQYLLRTCKVAVVPGISFGAAGAEYIRFSFAAPEDQQEAALERFRKHFRC